MYCIYQLTFAIITPALICGSFADRMKYWPMLVFMAVWHLLVYCPIAHAVWHPDGEHALYTVNRDAIHSATVIATSRHVTLLLL